MSDPRTTAAMAAARRSDCRTLLSPFLMRTANPRWKDYVESANCRRKYIILRMSLDITPRSVSRAILLRANADNDDDNDDAGTVTLMLMSR